jgi:hypothetical protein
VLDGLHEEVGGESFEPERRFVVVCGGIGEETMFRRRRTRAARDVRPTLRAAPRARGEVDTHL